MCNPDCVFYPHQDKVILPNYGLYVDHKNGKYMIHEWEFLSLFQANT
ncbi:hypothetical protein THF1C08_30211 [Vibrio jasicida]|uniref:Uncharacterized protein n=1 Tax=Vibrio jasicida TaxID=766224 RepID=A0AAU9QTA4_9VIBR|nr:hypothetical protein THF1C08_30211 [Vibrio jasicida]CAH1599648.1 hypothetical protein THF1A12_40224 [Vibrio jasicida]